MSGRPWRALPLAFAMIVAAGAAAQTSVKVGMVAELSGPFAEIGRQMVHGAKAYQKLHGDVVGGRKVELIVRDATGPAPEVAQRLAQELLGSDKVDFLAGFGMTPNALAVAPLATETRTPMVVMNAASSILTRKSPYLVRVSFTLAQVAAPLGTWAANNGIGKAYTLVADYAPGIDAETAFRKTFKAGGGEIVGAVRTPLRNVEFAPYLQRIKDARPQAVFIFLPVGEQPIAFMKAFAEHELGKTGIRVIATGDVTEDGQLEAMGETPLGMVTTHHYSAAHDSAQNRSFLKAYAEVAGPDYRPNFIAVGAWDGMAAIYEAVRRNGSGRIDGDRALATFKGLKLDSPRGPIMIDPETRDVVQTVYVRRVQKRGGRIQNVEFEQIPNLKDPGK